MATITTPRPTVTTLVGSDVPEAIRSLTTLGAPDYVDLFTVTVPGAAEHPVEAWGRAVFERTPLSRNSLRLWRTMGLRLGPRGSPDHIGGWAISARGDNWLRAETGSWYATAQAVCVVDDDRVSLSLSLRYDRRRIAALIWSVIVGPHQRAVPVMLRHAVKVMAA